MSIRGNLEGLGLILSPLKLIKKGSHIIKKGSKIIGNEIVKKVRNVKEGLYFNKLPYKKIEEIKLNDEIIQLITITDKRLCVLQPNRLLIYNYNMKKIDITILIRSNKIISLPNNKILPELIEKSNLLIYQIENNNYKIVQEIKRYYENSFIQFFSYSKLYINESTLFIKDFVSIYRDLNNKYDIQINIYLNSDNKNKTIINILELIEKNLLAIQEYYSLIYFYHLQTYELISKIDFSYVQNLISENSIGPCCKISKDKIGIPSFGGYIIIGDLDYFLPIDTIKVNKSRTISKIIKFSDGRFFSIEQYNQEEKIGFERPVVLQWKYDNEKFELEGNLSFNITHIKPISNFIELHNKNIALTFSGKKKIRIYSLNEQ